MQKPQDMYCLALVRRRDVRSLRDLTGEHLDLLQRMRQDCLRLLSDRYNIPAHEIRAYFHYPPSYYHLHIHFTHLALDAPGRDVGRAHLLDDVIDNLRSNPAYYQQRDMTILMGAEHALSASFLAAAKDAVQP